MLCQNQCVDTTEVANVVSVCFLSSHRRSNSNLAMIRHESTSVRPGGVSDCHLSRVFRRFFGTKTLVVAKLGPGNLVLNEARRQAWRCSSNTTADWT